MPIFKKGLCVSYPVNDEEPGCGFLFGSTWAPVMGYQGTLSILEGRAMRGGKTFSVRSFDSGFNFFLESVF